MSSPVATMQRLDAQPVELLLQHLADAGAIQIVIEVRPSPHRDGRAVVRWNAPTGAGHVAEGSDLAVALRRAVRIARAECGPTNKETDR